MKQLKKLSLTLALLITAAAGAWAQWTGGTYTATSIENLEAITVGADATLTINEGVTVTVSGGIYANGHTLTVKGAGMLTVTGTNGTNGANSDQYDGGGGGNGSAGFTGTLIVDGATVNVTGGNGGNGGSGFQYGGSGGNGAAGVSGSITLKSGSVTVTGGAGGLGGGAMMQGGSRGSAGQAVTETITASTAEESDDNSTWTAISGTTSSKRYVRAESTAPAVEVTISDDKSEASFKMPQYDVTATYTIKRDMSVDMAVTVQDAEQNSRFRVQNQGNSFVPVGLTNEQVMALFNVHDDIESKDLTAITDYTVQIFAADDNDQPTGTAMTFSNFTYAPGKYVVKAVAAEGSNYSGETALSNVFTLFQGYEVTVPAGEYVTYFKDEKLYVEDTDAKLYTITAVSGDKATATELTVAAAGTPLLVKNNAETEKTILLIPTTTDTPDNVEVYDGFKGTLTDTQIAASTTTQNNYALNGLQFVWVKYAIAIAANKAWLEVNTPSNARAISIVFGDTTGINEALRVKSEESADGDWYDLDGRKLQAAPKRKGVYIHNGRKEVVK